MSLTTAAALACLYTDAVEIYERARHEVEITRKDGRTQKYAATRYRQQIERGWNENALVPTIANIVRRPTVGYNHLAEADRPDLMVETLIDDDSKPYHFLFSPETKALARERLAEYRQGRGK